MTLKERKAAAPTAAPRHNRDNGVYHNLHRPSSEKAKEQLGDILLALHTPLERQQRGQLWRSFERQLHHYVDLRELGGAL